MKHVSLDTSGDHLLHLGSPILSPELQDTSSVESVEVEFVPEFFTNGCFSEQHDYDVFLLNQEIDTPFDNLNHQDSHACES